MAEDDTSSILFIQGNGLVQTGNRRSLAGRQSRGEEKQGSLQATRASDGEKKLSLGRFIETNHVVAACKQLSLIFTSIRSPSRPREIKIPQLPEARGLNQRRQVEENRRKEFVRRTKDSRMTTLELLERKDEIKPRPGPLAAASSCPPCLSQACSSPLLPHPPRQIARTRCLLDIQRKTKPWEPEPEGEANVP